MCIETFINRAKNGECVFLHQVRQAFDKESQKINCVLHLTSGGQKHFEMGIPEPKSEDESILIRDYFYARIYNILSMLGGKNMVLYTNGKGFAHELALSLHQAFGVSKARKDRQGYEKCLNVTDRMNVVMGFNSFSFEVVAGQCPTIQGEPEGEEIDVIAKFQRAIDKTQGKLICGMDIGGTDIKIVGAKNGHIDHIKEYDWNPSTFPCVDRIIDEVMLLVKLSRAILLLDSDVPKDILALKEEALKKDASLETMGRAVVALEGHIGVLKKIDGIGLSFPDVVIRDKIVGGETHKTKGARDHSPDYETEFMRLTRLNDLMLEEVTQAVHITNDGPMSAYTAAVELSLSERKDDIRKGMFAHSLGTELGAGWVNEQGEVPEYPLELYNCIIDIGNYVAKSYQPTDVRSLNNFNTGISGTLQKFCGQSGAFRLAEQYYRGDDSLYDELFEKGFITKNPDGSMVATQTPKDNRKAFLEHLLTQAQNGVEKAMKIFEHIGQALAATWLETEEVLQPKAKARVLFGRFIKRRSCFDLMCAGAKQVLPGIELLAADDELAYTQLMQELRDDPEYTVAQFGQAVGAVYFVASVL